ncbi:MAG: APC family permease [Solirubrobacteraceae bacterium]
MEATSITGPAPADQRAPRQELKKGAISYISNVVIGVASTAPGYSLAATVGFMVAVGGIGVHNPAVVIVSFIPMLFVAWAYQYMNEVDPDCGTSFSWISRTFSPELGLIIGWIVIVSDIVVNANQAQIAGSYGFQLFGLNGAAASTAAVIVLGGLFIILLTWICWRGIELSARTQQILLGFEMSTLIIFAVVALIKTYTDSPTHSMHVALNWFNPFSVSVSALISGMLLGVFLYWGWDTGVSVNEESENSDSGPGRSAVTSTVILIGIYLLVSVASQAYAGIGYLSNPNNANDIFAGGLAKGVLGSLHILLTIAVLTSATAATQTTIIPAARQALSMARRGAIPSRFAQVHERNLSPGTATIWAGVLSLIWFVAIELLSKNVLADCVAGLGILVCIYYGFTGFCCTWFYRFELRKSVRNFFMLGFFPTVGGLILMVILVKAVTYYGNAANDSSGAFLGMGVPVWIGILGVGSGILIMLYRKATAPAFFRNEKRVKYGDPIEVVTPEAEFAPADTML